LLLTALALVTVVAFGAFYGGFTEAAPGPALPSVRASASAEPLRRVAPSDGLAVSAASPEAERLEARRQLYESVDALVQASEYEKARRLLDEDQARYGDDLAAPWHDLEQSYRLLADCLEHPTRQLSVRARAFVQVSEAASLKPRLLRACGAAH
jgi:hypothetical protein